MNIRHNERTANDIARAIKYAISEQTRRRLLAGRITASRLGQRRNSDACQVDRFAYPRVAMHRTWPQLLAVARAFVRPS